MTAEQFTDYIGEKISPYSLRENERSSIANLYRKYPEKLLIECVDIGISRYFQYDPEDKLIQNSVQMFLENLGGIAYNKSRTPIEQEICHQINKCKSKYTYWNTNNANIIFQDYIRALRNAGWNDSQILQDLQNEVGQLSDNSHSWAQWSITMLNWIDDIKHKNDENSVTIKQEGTVLPTVLFDDLSPNLQSLCKQINASYENNLFDCTAVIMRRLLEGLLVLSYQNIGIESEIIDKSGTHYITLDKIIKNAEQNVDLALSTNTKRELRLFKDLGNYLAHKIWYNCTQQDIMPNMLKYRAIIEELLYKAGLK